MQDTKPSSANRRLSVLKRFYQLALRERRIDDDPCLNMASAKQPLRFVHTLSEAQVEALLDAPDVVDPAGPARAHHAGADVCERPAGVGTGALKLVELSLNDGVLRITGKGSKTRLVPFGEQARLLAGALPEGGARRDPRTARSTTPCS